MSADTIQLQQIAEQLPGLCEKAGQVIMDIYHSAESLDIGYKDDSSPLTAADTQSHEILSKGLASLTPHWPVLSEEQVLPAFAERSQWPCYWLLDPLDGTREFIERTGEFTINMALIENHRPVLGVVYSPLERRTYLGLVQEKKALRIDCHGRTEISVSAKTPTESIKVLGSRRYGGEEFEACIDKLAQLAPAIERQTAGSALKFCRLAEGEADIYPRFAPCCEWDTAAGQALLEAAGGSVVGLDFKPLQYNQKPSILNPHFYAFGSDSHLWVDILMA